MFTAYIFYCFCCCWPLLLIGVEGFNETCPPCFNCLLPGYSCFHYANCSEFTGRCVCPAGFGGEDCGTPVCNSLAEGEKRKIRPPGTNCQCSPGWTGINCNVCESDNACLPLVPTKQNATCYKGGLVVRENHQVCNVTNKKIVEMLPNTPPQVTFTCNRGASSCGFQFWIGQVESFYCKLDDCTFSEEYTSSKNETKYQCLTLGCKCREGEMLCGKDGGVDITDFLREEVKGPATFSCENNLCVFQEPAMNELIQSIFGDNFISLDCMGGECLHYSQVPGFKRPLKNSYFSAFLASVLAVFIFSLSVCIGWVWVLRKRYQAGSGYDLVPTNDPNDGAGTLEFTPAHLSFQNIGYEVQGRSVLRGGIRGLARPGQIMAIIGASGAGKTSLLDILASRSKHGTVTGEIRINGAITTSSNAWCGYVDQEDTLLSSLTVFEAVMFSALLRLPQDLSIEVKQQRVAETLRELGIYGIRDRRIGEPGARGISGGEKRRVSIACELVTSPAILFLDEPTSGLDSFNASVVVDSLVRLARDFHRTIVCTVHQPRSNIYAKFHQLVLLAEGLCLYSGPADEARDYFARLGFSCPLGFNVADYLVDITKQPASSAEETWQGEEIREEEEELNPWATPSSLATVNISPTAQPVDAGPRTGEEGRRRESTIVELNDHIQKLAKLFDASETATLLDEEVQQLQQNHADNPVSEPIVRKPGQWQQFLLLAERSLKHLYRSPGLMLTHYSSSVLLAVLCGFLFYNVTNDIAGFQNRLGVFFFICALFSFGCLTSLQSFNTERLVFMRERANGYYSPISYFGAKVLFDLLPLRVVPPLLLGLIVYHMVGLVPGLWALFKFLLVLVTFNVCAASICLFLGLAFANPSVANLLGSLTMLFSMLFGGLLLNKDSIPQHLRWLQHLSFFNYAFEALIVNEMRYLQLTEKKYGLEIDVPGATILSTFGFNATAYWSDLAKLSSMCCGFVILAFLAMVLLVKEKR